MQVLKMDARERTLDPTRIDEVLAMTRAWLDIGDDGKARQLTTLSSDLVLQALQAGERVLWQGWTLRTLPPRRIGLPLQASSEWVAGVLAVSAAGLLSELRVDIECVRRICLRIEGVENRQAQIRSQEARARTEWELEDG